MAALAELLQLPSSDPPAPTGHTPRHADPVALLTGIWSALHHSGRVCRYLPPAFQQQWRRCCEATLQALTTRTALCALLASLPRAGLVLPLDAAAGLPGSSAVSLEQLILQRIRALLGQPGLAVPHELHARSEAAEIAACSVLTSVLSPHLVLQWLETPAANGCLLVAWLPTLLQACAIFRTDQGCDGARRRTGL
jgi:hypothetical protein